MTFRNKMKIRSKQGDLILWVALLLVVCVLNASIYFPDNASLFLKVLLLISVIAFTTRNLELFLFILEVALFISYGFWIPSLLMTWPSLPFLLPALFPLFIASLFPSGRRFLSSVVRWGHIDRISKIWICLGSGVSVLALVVWAKWSDHLGSGVYLFQTWKNSPATLFFAVVPVFAIVNAFSEELFFRGLFQTVLKKSKFSLFWTIGFQALSFALVHNSDGFPNGKVGTGMAFAFGLMLGYLRNRSQGLIVPFIIHFIADLLIGYVLAYPVIRD